MNQEQRHANALCSEQCGRYLLYAGCSVFRLFPDSVLLRIEQEVSGLRCVYASWFGLRVQTLHWRGAR